MKALRSFTGFAPWAVGAATLLAACALSSTTGERSDDPEAPEASPSRAPSSAPMPGDPAASNGSPAGKDRAISAPTLQDPIAATLALKIREVATFPRTDTIPPPIDPRLNRAARINYLGEVPDGSGRMYVPDLNGRLYFARLRTGGVPRPYLDVRATFAPDFMSGRGLGSGFGFVAFHPDFARNGRFYTTHTEAFAALTTKTPDFTQPNAVVQSVITEWTATQPSADTFRGTHRELLRIGFGALIHAIQEIAFNPTATPQDPDFGLLYLAVGEGGQGVITTDPQNLAIPHGKILRIDPRGRNSANRKYGIPASNPFATRPGVLREIYAYGMRDPHRFSWDLGGTHRLFLGHIGEHTFESVYDVRPGDNLGWSEREGTLVFNRADPCHLTALPANDQTLGFTYPLALYGHNPPPNFPCGQDVGRAISGGFVYRGVNVAALRGKYVFGDLVDGRIFYTNESEMRRGGPPATIFELKILDDAGRLLSMSQVVGDPRVDLRFGEDGPGELYLLSKANGKIWRVTSAPPRPTAPLVP